MFYHVSTQWLSSTVQCKYISSSYTWYWEAPSFKQLTYFEICSVFCIYLIWSRILEERDFCFHLDNVHYPHCLEIQKKTMLGWSFRSIMVNSVYVVISAPMQTSSAHIPSVPCAVLKALGQHKACLLWLVTQHWFCWYNALS